MGTGLLIGLIVAGLAGVVVVLLLIKVLIAWFFELNLFIKKIEHIEELLGKILISIADQPIPPKV